MDNSFILECSNLTKIYRIFPGKKIYALKDFSINVPGGVVFSIIGPNGSGKTTLFKILMGFITRFSGQFILRGSVNGRNISVREKIGFLPENPSIYPDLNAYESLKFYGSFFKESRISSKENIERLMELVGLTEHRNKKVKEYSKGMIQRLSIAQAIINNPELLILDELTSGLDPFVTEEINAIIIKLKKEGKTIILSSHLLGHIQDISDTIGILFMGRLLKVGTLKDITQVSDRGIIIFDTKGKPLHECREVISSCGIEIFNVDYLTNDLEEAFKDIVKKEKEK
ncbi:MAG: ABC transporter ATP-binding protein [Candidatus Aureabacteria bacterium]|nr:ABC transporter ATP-binding protein [Candidatus Auribacterota bacterium]